MSFSTNNRRKKRENVLVVFIDSGGIPIENRILAIECVLSDAFIHSRSRGTMRKRNGDVDVVQGRNHVQIGFILQIDGAGGIRRLGPAGDVQRQVGLVRIGNLPTEQGNGVV